MGTADLDVDSATAIYSMKDMRTRQWVGRVPLLVAACGTIALRNLMPAWAFMWSLAFAIYAGLKWLSWWSVQGRIRHSNWRSAAYLLGWPGMDAESFLNSDCPVSKPAVPQWVAGFITAIMGIGLLWVLARRIPEEHPLMRGWVGMLGLILLLHFGTFKIIALIWRSMGVDAVPIMDAPLRSTSLSEFWGKRWNLGFRQLAYDLIFSPLHKVLGGPATGFLVFVVSGLLHDLVISFPARAGYGLPTTYFVIQGLGVAVERSQFGKRLGLGRHALGWLFMATVTAAPAYWLFHPQFVTRVILPFMRAIRAI